MEMVKKVNEYLEISKRQSNMQIYGVLACSLVFVIPFLIIMANGWWGPFGNAADGWRWAITSFIMLALVYVSLIFDKKYRSH